MSTTITTPTVLEGKTLAGDLTIRDTHDVLVRNCRFSGSLMIPSGTNITVEDSTFGGPFLLVGSHGSSSIITMRPTLRGCHFPGIGKGVLSGGHPMNFWNVRELVTERCRFDVTVEPNVTGDAAEGPIWYFDVSGARSTDDEIRIHAKRSCYALWRWRSDTKLNKGCIGNRFTRLQLIVDGVGGQILPSSSANCGAQDYMPQCVGQWHTQYDECLFDASACTGPVEMVWQGGTHRQRILNCTFKVPVRMFDLHEITLYRSKFGVLKFTDEYQRPLPHRADVFQIGTTIEKETVAPRIAAVPHWRVVMS